MVGAGVLHLTTQRQEFRALCGGGWLRRSRHD
jgi:hypothetical protein